MQNYNKKIFLPITLLFLLSIILVPLVISAQDAIVPQTCGNAGQDPCGITDFFTMLVNIYTFIVKWIATPLATIALIIGGILMMISAGNPNLMGTGKKIFWSAIIGLVLVFCSWLIIDFILGAIGYNPSKPWNQL